MDFVDSYIAFVDILGFKDFVASNESSHPEKVISLLSSLKDKESSVNSNVYNDCIVSVISDSIIISCDKGALDSAFQVTFCLLEIAHDLLKNGLFFRGAITQGNIIHNLEKNIIAGTGYVKSYLIESQEAVYPRIILDTDTPNPAHSNMTNPFCNEDARLHLNDLICIDFDGNKVLDIFVCLCAYSKLTLSELENLCSSAATLQNSTNPKIRAKGHYIAQSLGRFIRSYHHAEATKLCSKIGQRSMNI